MPKIANETYNNERLDDLSRRVYYKAMEAMEKILDEVQTPEDLVTLRALAAVADSAGVGIKEEDAEESY